MDKIITSNDLVYLTRIILSIIAGAVIGYEREHREKVAGLRTHILISMSAALMMIISKYAFMDVLSDPVVGGMSLDVSRVAAGIITGMGILSGGIVFISKRGNVSGLTTAAGIWATIGIGMVIGAGMYAVGIGSVILVEIIQLALYRDLPVYKHSTMAIVKCILDDADSDYDRLIERLNKYDAKVSSIKWEKLGENKTELHCSIFFGTKYTRDDIIDILNGMEEIKRFELP